MLYRQLGEVIHTGNRSYLCFDMAFKLTFFVLEISRRFKIRFKMIILIYLDQSTISMGEINIVLVILALLANKFTFGSSGCKPQRVEYISRNGLQDNETLGLHYDITKCKNTFELTIGYCSLISTRTCTLIDQPSVSSEVIGLLELYVSAEPPRDNWDGMIFASLYLRFWTNGTSINELGISGPDKSESHYDNRTKVALEIQQQLQRALNPDPDFKMNIIQLRA